MMKKRMFIFTLLLTLIIGVLMNNNVVYASNETLFSTEVNTQVDEYVMQIAPKHIAILLQNSQNYNYTNYSITRGIRQYNLVNNELVGSNTYYYLIYGNENIIAVLVAVNNVDGEIYTNLTDSYAQILDQELENGMNENIMIATDSSLYMLRANNDLILLESTEKNPSRPSITYNDIEIDCDYTDIDETTTLDVSAIPMLTSNISINVPIVRQYSDPICWAASMASILNYTNGTSLTAKEVANATGHGIDGATYSEVKEYYSSTYNMSVTGAGTLSSTVVATQLNKGKPIQVFHFPSSGTGHSMVLAGLSQLSSDVFYVYMDPNSSSYRTVSVSQAALTDGTKVAVTVGGTTMYWKNSIYNIH